MSRTQELVERLRNRFDPFENGPDELCRAAAARLAELDYDTEYLRRLMANIAELERENAALREALKPFAELGATNWTLNECPPHQTCDIEQADIHRARTALAGSGEK
jgi:hypothetical protein